MPVAPHVPMPCACSTLGSLYQSSSGALVTAPSAPRCGGARRSDALLSWAAEHFPCAGFLLYEQLCPQDPFGRVMQQHFARLGSALRSLAQYPDCEAQRSRFLAQVGS